MTEASFIATQINSQVFVHPTAVYLLLSLMYFVLCFGLSRVALMIERRQARRDLPRPARSPGSPTASSALNA